jgi:hypothetical protein
MENIDEHDERPIVQLTSKMIRYPSYLIIAQFPGYKAHGSIDIIGATTIFKSEQDRF